MQHCDTTSGSPTYHDGRVTRPRLLICPTPRPLAMRFTASAALRQAVAGAARRIGRRQEYVWLLSLRNNKTAGRNDFATENKRHYPANSESTPDLQPHAPCIRNKYPAPRHQSNSQPLSYTGCAVWGQSRACSKERVRRSPDAGYAPQDQIVVERASSRRVRER